jgi:hypothetical protein
VAVGVGVGPAVGGTGVGDACWVSAGVDPAGAGVDPAGTGVEAAGVDPAGVGAGAAGVEMKLAPRGVGVVLAGTGDAAPAVGPAVAKDTTRGVEVAGPLATVAFAGLSDEQLEIAATRANPNASPPITRQTRELCMVPPPVLGAELKADVCAASTARLRRIVPHAADARKPVRPSLGGFLSIKPAPVFRQTSQVWENV